MADPKETNEKYNVKRFRSVGKENPDYGQARDWLRAVSFGFHDEQQSDELIDKILAMYQADNRELTGVYVNDEPRCMPSTRAFRWQRSERWKTS